MIGEDGTNKAALNLTESLSPQLYHQLARRKTKLVLQVVIEVTA
jgi:hypothetical protein